MKTIVLLIVNAIALTLFSEYVVSRPVEWYVSTPASIIVVVLLWLLLQNLVNLIVKKLKL